MPKKQVNAFYFYMKELEPMLRREGRVFPNGMADIVPIAHPRWKALPEKEKERFERMTKEYKAKMRGQEGDKYRQDNQGNILAHRRDPYTELEKRRMAEKKEIVKNWPPGKELVNEQFYFINFQTLCVTEDGDYLPAEIAVIEYTLAAGITKTLHRFIQPGKIPTGYRYTCITNSDDTHMIPIENFDLADANYRGLWIQLENFLNPNGEKPEYPPLYCLGMKDDYKIVEYCLEWIHGRSCLGGPNKLRKVFEVESLLQGMLAHVGSVVSKSSCIDLLTSSEWDYESGTRCEYHEEKEAKYCSLGIVNRYAYAISDNLSKVYDFKLTPTHIPMRRDVGSITVLSPSSMPVCNRQDSRLPQKTNAFIKPKQPRREPVEEDYTELRIPQAPEPAAPAWGGAGPRGGAMGGPSGYSSMGGVRAPEPAYGGGPSGDGFNTGGRGRGVSMGLDEDFPGLSISGGLDDFPALGGMSGGRGAPMPQSMPMGRGMAAVPMPNYAGRAGPPQPSQAPIPPTNWQQPPAMPSQRPAGIGRGLATQASPPQPMGDGLEGMRIPGQSAAGRGMNGQGSRPAPAQVDDGLAPLRMPGGASTAAATGQFQNAEIDNLESSSKLIGVTGRGRGALLETVMKQNGVKPKGRGFVPDDWVDDGSLGPVRR